MLRISAMLLLREAKAIPKKPEKYCLLSLIVENIKFLQITIASNEEHAKPILYDIPFQAVRETKTNIYVFHFVLHESIDNKNVIAEKTEDDVKTQVGKTKRRLTPKKVLRTIEKIDSVYHEMMSTLTT